MGVEVGGLLEEGGGRWVGIYGGKKKKEKDRKEQRL